MWVKWSPFCYFRESFFKKEGPRKGGGKGREFEHIGTDCSIIHEKTNRRFAAILEHSGQMKKPRLELRQNPGCLSGEIMTPTKIALILEVYFFCAPFDAVT